MRPFLLLCCCLLCLSGNAQTASEPALTDVIEVRGEPNLKGTLIGYDYGRSATLVTEAGELVTVPWDKMIRVTYHSEQVVAAQPLKAWLQIDTMMVLPQRRWRHQVMITTSFADGGFSNGFGNSAIIGPGVNYHLLFTRQKLSIGPGVGYEVMSNRRDERLASLTGLAEYRLGRGRVRTFGRLIGGLNLPLGGDQLDIEDRGLGFTYHPSVGILLMPRKGRWANLALDLGYRVSRVRFSAVTPNLELLDREISYQRLTLGLAARF